MSMSPSSATTSAPEVLSAFPPQFSLVRCTAEVISAYDRGVLDVRENTHLRALARELMRYVVNLLDDPRFQRGLYCNAWNSAFGAARGRAAPLTEDLMTESFHLPNLADGREHIRESLAGMLRRESRLFRSPEVMNRLTAELTLGMKQKVDSPDPGRELIEGVRPRIEALAASTEEGKDLSAREKGMLLQAAEALCVYLRPKERDDIDVCVSGNPRDFSFRVAVAFRERLAAAFPALTVGDQRKLVGYLLSWDLIDQERRGVIDDLTRLKSSLLKRWRDPKLGLSAGEGEMIFSRALTLRGPDSPYSAAELLRREALNGDPVLAAEVVEPIIRLAREARREVARSFTVMSEGEIDALMLVRMIECAFACMPVPPELEVAVRSAYLGASRARALSQARHSDLRDTDSLHVHLVAGKPPRVLEAVYLAGARSVTVCGDLSDDGVMPDGESDDLIKRALFLSKDEPTWFELNVVAEAIGVGPAIVAHELGALDRPCPFSFSDASPPRVVRELEQHHRGSVAWIEGAEGEVTVVLLFDPDQESSLPGWEIQERCPGIFELTRSSLRAVDEPAITKPSEGSGARETEIPAPVTPSDRAPEGQPSATVVAVGHDACGEKQRDQLDTADERGQQQVSTPAVQLSEQARVDLKQWLSAAAVFSEFPLETKETDLVQRLARSPHVSRKDLRAAHRLVSALTDRDHSPVFHDLEVYEIRRELAEVLKEALSKN